MDECARGPPSRASRRRAAPAHVPVVHAAVAGGRRDARGALRGGGRPVPRGRREGGRAGDPNAELFAAMVGFTANSRCAATSSRRPRVRAGQGRQLAGRPRLPPIRRVAARRARRTTRRDGSSRAAWRRAASPSTPTGRRPSENAPSAACALGDRDARRDDLRPAAPFAGRPITAGRAVASYGAADRLLGELAALLGRRATPSAICARRSRSTRRWAPPSGPFTAARRSALRDDRSVHDVA